MDPASVQTALEAAFADTELLENTCPVTSASAVVPETGDIEDLATSSFQLGAGDADLLVLNALCIKSGLFTKRLRAAAARVLRPESGPLDIIDVEALEEAEEAAELRVDVGDQLVLSVGATPIMRADCERIARFGAIDNTAETTYLFSWDPAARARMQAAARPHPTSGGEAATGENPLFITRILAHVAEQLKYEHIYQRGDDAGVFTVLGLKNIVWI